MNSSKINYSKFFGLTEFNYNNKLVEINFDFNDSTFTEESKMSLIHLRDKHNFNKYGTVYEVEIKNNNIKLKEKNRLFPILEKFNYDFEANVNNSNKIINKFRKINQVSFEFTERTADCKLIIKSINKISDINSWSPSTEVMINETIEYEQHSFLTLIVPGFEDLSGIRNLLVQFLENQILGVERLYEIILEKNEIILFPKISDSKSFIDSLNPILDLFIEFMKEYISDQFYNCICEDGCYNCFYDTRYEERGKETSLPSKNEIFKLVSNLRKEDGVDDLINIRSKGEKIEENSFTGIISKWQKSVLEILQKRLEFKINDVYPIRKSNLEERFLGICDHENKIILIDESVSPLNYIIEVIAHEYTHNWQIENMAESLRSENIPFNGKLFIEGFAQWVEFRVMDYLGQHVNMKHITLLSIDSKDPNEYGLGFRICRYIEEQYGFKNLINFMINMQIVFENKTLNYDDITKGFGLENYIDLK